MKDFARSGVQNPSVCRTRRGSGLGPARRPSEVAPAPARTSPAAPRPASPRFSPPHEGFRTVWCAESFGVPDSPRLRPRTSPAAIRGRPGSGLEPARGHPRSPRLRLGPARRPSEVAPAPASNRPAATRGRRGSGSDQPGGHPRSPRLRPRTGPAATRGRPGSGSDEPGGPPRRASPRILARLREGFRALWCAESFGVPESPRLRPRPGPRPPAVAPAPASSRPGGPSARLLPGFLPVYVKDFARSGVQNPSVCRSRRGSGPDPARGHPRSPRPRPRAGPAAPPPGRGGGRTAYGVVLIAVWPIR